MFSSRFTGNSYTTRGVLSRYRLTRFRRVRSARVAIPTAQLHSLQANTRFHGPRLHFGAGTHLPTPQPYLLMAARQTDIVTTIALPLVMGVTTALSPFSLSLSLHLAHLFDAFPSVIILLSFSAPDSASVDHPCLFRHPCPCSSSYSSFRLPTLSLSLTPLLGPSSLVLFSSFRTFSLTIECTRNRSHRLPSSVIAHFGHSC